MAAEEKETDVLLKKTDFGEKEWCNPVIVFTPVFCSGRSLFGTLLCRNSNTEVEFHWTHDTVDKPAYN